MKHKLTMTALLAAMLGSAAWLGLTTVRAAVPVKPAPTLRPVPGGLDGLPKTGLADLLGGKLFPTTLKSEDLASGYTLVVLVDAQGKPGTYATKGETFAVGGENFLAAYIVPLVPSQTGPVAVKPDSNAVLILINLHAVEALGDITPVTIASKADAAAPPTNTPSPENK